MSGFVFSQNPPLKFDAKVQKFSKVNEGEEVNLKYQFINQGDKPVVINEAKVNCTCTEVTFPKEPFKPNSTGTVNVKFDTKGKIGFQERTVTLLTDQGNVEIVFKGVVKASDKTLEEYKQNN